MISQADMRNILRHRCEAAGGQKAWALANGISPQYVGDILTGRRDVAARLAKILGYERTISFFACKPQNDGA